LGVHKLNDSKLEAGASRNTLEDISTARKIEQHMSDADYRPLSGQIGYHGSLAGQRTDYGIQRRPSQGLVSLIKNQDFKRWSKTALLASAYASALEFWIPKNQICSGKTSNAAQV
jgi:hypothetical protein